MEDEKKDVLAPEAESEAGPDEVLLSDSVSEEEENDFVDDFTLKEAEEKKRKAEEEEANKKEEEQKAVEEAPEAEESRRSLHIDPAYEGGATEVVIPSLGKQGYEYGNEKLEAIENSRKAWVKSYRIGSIIKISVSMVALAAIFVGWIVPSRLMTDAGNTPLYIALGIAGGAIVIILVTSFLLKRRNKGVIATYFKAFYDAFDGYAFEGLPIEDLQGSVDDKIAKEEFDAGKAFKPTHSVGSRDSLMFTYKGTQAALADAAGEEAREKGALATSFVGKFLRMHNNLGLSDDGVIIYLKGNERAIPPSALLQRAPAIEDPRYNIYGSDKDIAKIPEEALAKLLGVRTNKLLVDVTVSIQKERTFMYLGYEDTLMVLPNKEHFDPNYLIAYKKQLEEFLEFGWLLDQK